MPATSEKALKRKRERIREWKQENKEKMREQKARYRQQCKARAVLRKVSKTYTLKELHVVLVDCRRPSSPLQKRKKKTVSSEKALKRRRQKIKEWKQENKEKVREQKARYRQRRRERAAMKKIPETYTLKELHVVLVDCRRPPPSPPPPPQKR